MPVVICTPYAHNNSPSLDNYITTDGSDPFYPQNVMLMHMNSSPITDNMGTSIRTVGTGMSISAEQAKFGNSSAKFLGTGGYLNNIPTIGRKDFTIECWVQLSSLSGVSHAFFDTRAGLNGADIYLGYSVTSRTVIYYPDLTNSGFSIGGALVMNIGQWYHFAVSRRDAVVRVFVDGVQLGNSYLSANNITSTQITWGANNLSSDATRNLRGYLDEVRITSGVGRYASNFSPITSAFPDQATPA